MSGLTIDTNTKEEMARRVAAFDGDTKYTQEVICPHCGYEYRDSWEMQDGTTDCPECRNSFIVEKDVEITYCTTKDEEHQIGIIKAQNSESEGQE